MEINKNTQYNQGVGKYKVLSSTSGVGSIVPNKWGGFVMPMSSSLWKFVEATDKEVSKCQDSLLDMKKISEEVGVDLVDDSRFVSFLRETEGMSNLKCLVAIPHVNLNQYNTCDIKNHPLAIRYQENHPNNNGLNEGMFTIPSIVFPRWFYSTKSFEFKPVDEWLKEWKRKSCNDGKEVYFAPPRDPQLKTNRKHFERLNDPTIYGLLEQIGMVLICENGHISDIPWQQYFCAKLDKWPRLNDPDGGDCDLFNYEMTDCEKGGPHKLQWLENRNRSESFGVLKCSGCGKSVSLEGIMNIRPLCQGHRPWEGVLAKDVIPCKVNNSKGVMRWALVTSNSVYYAEQFSSLYIPDCYLNNVGVLNSVQKKVLDLIKNKWFPKFKEKFPEKDEFDFWNPSMIIDKSDDSEIVISPIDVDVISRHFLPQNESNTQSVDVRENYRYTEYSVFTSNSSSINGSDKLVFNDVVLKDEISSYFSMIKQVSTLALSCTQINFSRVQMPQPTLRADGSVEYPSSMKIFKGAQSEVRVMPANQTFGEGIFFDFNNSAIESWIASYGDDFEERYKSDEKRESMYDALYTKMQKGGVAKFYLLHTFSHILMKELEFSCGYPCASLSERLYFSGRMCGVLIYTADGSEGSMGGLVWQGQSNLISKIIKSALRRALDCSSDPICWENEDQLNHAACFSCTMVSETSCEERNMGLDRRILVDEKFGFFKDLIH